MVRNKKHFAIQMHRCGQGASVNVHIAGSSRDLQHRMLFSPRRLLLLFSARYSQIAFEVGSSSVSSGSYGRMFA